HANVVLSKKAEAVGSQAPRRVSCQCGSALDPQKVVGQCMHDGICRRQGVWRRGGIEREEATGEIVIREIHKCSTIFAAKLPRVAATVIGNVVQDLIGLAGAAARNAK